MEIRGYTPENIQTQANLPESRANTRKQMLATGKNILLKRMPSPTSEEISFLNLIN